MAHKYKTTTEVHAALVKLFTKYPSIHQDDFDRVVGTADQPILQNWGADDVIYGGAYATTHSTLLDALQHGVQDGHFRVTGTLPNLEYSMVTK